jgi:hypothetical protein
MLLLCGQQVPAGWSQYIANRIQADRCAGPSDVGTPGAVTALLLHKKEHRRAQYCQMAWRCWGGGGAKCPHPLLLRPGLVLMSLALRIHAADGKEPTYRISWESIGG